MYIYVLIVPYFNLCFHVIHNYIYSNTYHVTICNHKRLFMDVPGKKKQEFFCCPSLRDAEKPANFGCRISTERIQCLPTLRLLKTNLQQALFFFDQFSRIYPLRWRCSSVPSPANPPLRGAPGHHGESR